MKDSSGLHFKTCLFILLMVMFAPLGNVLLSKGMKRIGSAKTWAPGDVLHILFRILSSGYIWLGIACLLSYFLLGETEPPLRWAGILVICVGVFIVGHTHPRTTEKA